MLSFRRPTDEQIRQYLAEQGRQPFSYTAIGCTRGEPQPRRGWNIDRNRVLLGRGRDLFEAAARAIDQWRMFPPAVATVCWPAQPREGAVVAVRYFAAPLRLWMLFPARIVYVLADTIERDARRIERLGFAYGTLPDHPERGEERFAVEWNQTDDSVWYDLLAISQPAHWLARVGYPYTRWEQVRFRRLSGTAMQTAVMPATVSED